MTAETYGTLAGIYDWPVPDEPPNPAGTIAAFPDMIDESDNGARVRAPSTYSPETKRYP